MAQKFKERVLAGSGFSNRKVESDFASKLMKKMGWNEGQGLGKNKNGQVECLQIQRRTEFLGLGNDAAAGTQWNDQWWERGYNSTLVNLVPINNVIETKKLAAEDSATSSDESVVQVVKKKITKKRK